MKVISLMFLSLLGVSLFAAFANASAGAAIAAEPARSAEGKVLVAYFSSTDNTKRIAEMIAQHSGAELYPITPEAVYTTGDLNYRDPASRASKEHDDPSIRPAISGAVEGMDDYDIIFVGYPIWWGEAPNIISTFLESYAFRGKTIVPFCTSSSSGLGASDRNLHRLSADSVRWLPGKRFPTSASRESVETWIDSLGI